MLNKSIYYLILICTILVFQGCTCGFYCSIGKTVEVKTEDVEVKSEIDADILPLLMKAFVAGQNYMEIEE